MPGGKQLVQGGRRGALAASTGQKTCLEACLVLSKTALSLPEVPLQQGVLPRLCHDVLSDVISLMKPIRLQAGVRVGCAPAVGCGTPVQAGGQRGTRRVG